MNYSEYTVSVSTDPSYYGEVTAERAAAIAESISSLIAAEFPGIQIKIYDGYGSAKTTGPDEAIIDEINQWIQDNWTAAL